jgi:hypothetical protein
MGWRAGSEAVRHQATGGSSAEPATMTSLGRGDGLSLQDVCRCIAEQWHEGDTVPASQGRFAVLEYHARFERILRLIKKPSVMFIAMNRFKVRKGEEAALETRRRARDNHLHAVPGFVEFHLLKGLERDDQCALCLALAVAVARRV